MIPNKIILTYKDNNIPDYVLKNLKLLNPDKEILFYTDKDVEKFLLTEYDSSYVDFFYSVTLGCTKGDFFRYCYLVKYGGYYCDIDIKHIEPISNYIVDNLEFFSVNAHVPPRTFQALLYCEAEHPIIKDCLLDIMKPESAKDLFYNTTSDMYKNIKKHIGFKDEILPNGIYDIKENSKIQIAQEVKLNEQYACMVSNRIVAMSRYPNYRIEQGFKDT